MPLRAQMLENVTWMLCSVFLPACISIKFNQVDIEIYSSFKFDVVSRLLRGLEGEMAVQSMECLVSR